MMKLGIAKQIMAEIERIEGEASNLYTVRAFGRLARICDTGGEPHTDDAQKILAILREVPTAADGEFPVWNALMAEMK